MYQQHRGKLCQGIVITNFKKCRSDTLAVKQRIILKIKQIKLNSGIFANCTGTARMLTLYACCSLPADNLDGVWESGGRASPAQRRLS